MPRIDLAVTTHRLNVNPNHKPVKQKRRKLNIKCNQIVNDEVCKLIEARFIREVRYPDWLATAGHELLSFMDAFSGYIQILMHQDDQERTTFIMERGIYCYKVMPFGLKNIGTTY